MSSDWSRESLQAALDASPYIAFARMQVESFDAEGSLVVSMPIRDEFRRLAGENMFHGGPVAALIDTAGDFAIALLCGGGVPTVNFRVDYLRPCIGTHLLAEAKVRKVGRSLGVADVSVFDPEKRLCAVGRGTYSTTAG